MGGDNVHAICSDCDQKFRFTARSTFRCDLKFRFTTLQTNVGLVDFSPPYQHSHATTCTRGIYVVTSAPVQAAGALSRCPGWHRDPRGHRERCRGTHWHGAQIDMAEKIAPHSLSWTIFVATWIALGHGHVLWGTLMYPRARSCV